MGLLDNNKVLTQELTGLEGTNFVPIVSNDKVDIWTWTKNDNQKRLRVTFRDIYAWSDDDAVYLVKGKITDTPTKIAVNATNFPNLRAGVGNVLPKVERVIAAPCDFFFKAGAGVASYGNRVQNSGHNCRICVIFQNGQIYHNYPSCYNDADFYNKTYAVQGGATVGSMFTKFDESVVWDLASRKHPVKTTTGDDATLIATGKYYYNPALPENAYEFHPAIGVANGYGNTAGFGATNSVNDASGGTDIGTRCRFWRTNPDNADANSFSYMGGYVADNQFTMIGTYRSNSSANPCRICVFGTNDGGRSWYAMYEFGGHERIKYGTNYVNAEGAIGIMLKQVGSEGSGVYNIRRRTLVIPSSSDKEPSTVFEYENAINVSSIVGTSDGITFTTASAHGFNNGDAIVVGFQSGVSANSRDFDWMVNSGVDDTSGGNGILLVVSSVTTTTFVVSLYIWNPDNGLPVRHIHALNRCKDGVAVSSGEAYPSGGWILYNPIKEVDSYAGYNVALLSMNKFIRLNSTKDSFQRPLGVLVKEEGNETYCYIGVDNESTPMNDVEMPEGRTQTFKHNSVGVWKCKLDEIDSQKDYGLLKFPAKQTCFGFQHILGVMVFVGNFGELGISYDNGESWESVNLPAGVAGQDRCHFSGPTDDRKFSIDNVLIQLKK